MDFKDALNRVMDSQKLSQADLCRITGISTSVMSRYVTGETDPSLSKAILMADALQISLDELTGRTTPKRAIERDLLGNFRQLNDEGQEIAVNLIYGMLSTYKKNNTVRVGETKSA